MLKPYKDPYGYKKLLAYQKAEQLQLACAEVTREFPKIKTLMSLADQMDRSARSGKQNIVEGWRRNTTKEYYDFLGFSIGAIAELEEDCDDIWKGIYPDLMGLKGIMGKMGCEREEVKGEEMESVEGDTDRIMGEIGYKREKGLGGEMGNPLSPLNPLNSPFDIEKLKFYPLDENLPPVVKLKLRCKELNFILHRLQESLLSKMQQEKTLPIKDKQKIITMQKKEDDAVHAAMLEEFGLEVLENGQVVEKRSSN